MRTFCTLRYLECHSFKTVIDQFRTKFEIDKAPYKFLNANWVGKLKTEGNLNDLRSKTPNRGTHSGRKILYNQVLKHSIRNFVIAFPSRSTRKRSQALAIVRTSMIRVMKEDLNFFPYHISTHQTLSEKA